MKTPHNTALEAKVAARNKVNALALEMAPKMIEALRPFLGKKIVNQTGCLAAKVRACLPDDNGGTDSQFWYRANNYSVYAYFKVCEPSKGRLFGQMFNGEIAQDCIGNYAECHVPLCHVEGLDLKTLMNAPELRTDHSVAEVQSARLALREAQNALDAARSNLHGFGEHDN